ncbi:unnamed protein product [Musa textilis]
MVWDPCRRHGFRRRAPSPAVRPGHRLPRWRRPAVRGQTRARPLPQGRRLHSRPDRAPPVPPPPLPILNLPSISSIPPPLITLSSFSTTSPSNSRSLLPSPFPPRPSPLRLPSPTSTALASTALASSSTLRLRLRLCLLPPSWRRTTSSSSSTRWRRGSLLPSGQWLCPRLHRRKGALFLASFALPSF